MLLQLRTSVAQTGQIDAQLLNCVGCHAWLDRFWVMCDEERLFCLYDYNTGFALK